MGSTLEEIICSYTLGTAATNKGQQRQIREDKDKEELAAASKYNTIHRNPTDAM